MTIEIPDELVKDLEPVMAVERKTLNELAVEQLRGLVPKPRRTPQQILEYLRSLPKADPSAVDEMERHIAEGKIPVRQEGIFDTE